MQSAPIPEHGWYDILDRQPDDTGKFDCVVIDGSKAIYPALFIPRRDGEGPWWKLCITANHRLEYRDVLCIRAPEWRPRPPRKTARKRKP